MALSELKPSHVVQEEGGKYTFSGEQPPKGPDKWSDVDITKVGTQDTPKEKGHDTYTGIPGDGIVPG